MQKLIDGAKKEGTFTIYTSATVDDMAVLTAAFEKKYGVKPQVWRASSENIIQRASTEARGGRFDVDVFETDGVGDGGACTARSSCRWSSRRCSSDLIPAAIPPHGEWIGDRVQIFTAAYNTGQIKKADLPKTYDDLTNPKWKGKLGVEAADSDWFVDRRRPTWARRRASSCSATSSTKNGLSVRKGHTLLANLVVSGEVPLALTTYLYKVAQLKNDGAPIDWFALPPEVARSQGTGMARKAPAPQRRGPVHRFPADRRPGNPGQARLHPDQPQGQAAAGGHDAEVRRPGEDSRRERQVG